MLKVDRIASYQEKYISPLILNLGTMDSLRNTECLKVQYVILQHGGHGTMCYEPTNLFKVKECEWNNIGHKGSNCPMCHGTGSIRTPMTQKEVVDMVKSMIKSRQSHNFLGYELPSGERIEVEK